MINGCLGSTHGGGMEKGFHSINALLVLLLCIVFCGNLCVVLGDVVVHQHDVVVEKCEIL